MERVSNFGKRLRILLDLNNMSANELAIKLDISKSLISRYLSNQAVAKQDRIDQIARFFHVSHAWILGYDCEMYVPDLKVNIIKTIENFDESQLNEVYKYVIKVKENLKRWNVLLFMLDTHPANKENNQ